MEDSSEAPRRGGVSARRQGAKPTVGVKRPVTKTVRRQLHLGEKTVERLGVHASLVHRNESAIADEILRNWLARFGKGRELFGPDPDLLGSEAESPTE